MNQEMNVNLRGESRGDKLEPRPTVAPLVDVFESKDEVLVLAELPGVAKEDISVQLDKRELTIGGRRPAETLGGTTHRKAFDYKRTFLVPQGIDADKIAADLKDGVLSVRLPKSQALKPRQIAVKTS